MGDEIDLREYLRILWRRRHTVGAVTLAAVLAAVLFSLLSSPVYEAEALIQLSEESAPAYANPASAAQVLRNPSFLDGIARAAGLAVTGRGLRNLVKVDSVRDTRMIRLRVRYKDARQAEELTSAISLAFVARASVRVQEKRKPLEARLDSVNAQLAEIQRILQLTRATLSRLQQGSTLSGEDRGFLRSLTLYAMWLQDTQRELTAKLASLEPPTLVEAPSVPLEPVASRMGVNVLLIGILGLMSGCTLAFVLEYFKPEAPAPVPQSVATLAPDRPHR